jgi:alpha-amylase
MEKLPIGLLTILIAFALIIAGCSLFGKKEIKPFVSDVIHPEWTKNAVLYEVNIRQFTPEGTFNAFAEHLPRLKDLGVDILWFMPISPIGVKNRKPLLGSYYSVKDYKDVNPEFGNLEDFRSLVAKAHDLGFHVIIDWVPNHSAWDNQLATDHPDWYSKDSIGNFIPPIGFDWTDVIQFDWSNKDLQDYMIGALKFWVELGVDGFRVDHPHITPYEFWERARTELNTLKPVLMIAENEDQTDFLKKGFDMNYSWVLHHMMNNVARKKESVKAVTRYFNKEKSVFPQNVYRMVFLDNHDENSWNGTINSRMGEAQVPFAVLVFTAQGFPLLYNGQEACLDKSLKFFVKDTIKWDTCRMTSFYKDLIKMKKENKALWNGDFGGPMSDIKTNKKNKIIAFYREKDGNRVVVFLNLTKKSVTFKPDINAVEGDYKDYFTGQKTGLTKNFRVTIDPWGYKVFVK